MADSAPNPADLDQGLPPDLGFEAARQAQILHWAATTPEQRLAWLSEAQRFAHGVGALPRVRPSTDLEGWEPQPLTTIDQPRRSISPGRRGGS